MDKVKAELEQTRGHLKNVTKYAIAHLEALLEKYGPLYPRLTKSSRYDEVDAREAAFKAFKVAYDRESGYVGHKVSGEEFKLDCTKFDKLLMVFKDGHYQVVELPEKMFVGPDMVYCGLPERDRVMTLAYTNREASYLKRFTFGGTILNKEYFCIPPKSRILFFEPETPAELFIRYKAAPYQKINQQTCRPSQVEVKGPKTRGRQISIKEVAAINSKPPRGWDPEAATDEIGIRMSPPSPEGTTAGVEVVIFRRTSRLISFSMRARSLSERRLASSPARGLAQFRRVRRFASP